MNARFEGLENAVESIFGPNGIYHQKDIGLLLEGLRQKRKVNSLGSNQEKLRTMGQKFSGSAHNRDEPEVCLPQAVCIERKCTLMHRSFVGVNIYKAIRH